MDFKAVVYQDEALWAAHCLELDIVAFGRNPSDAARSLFLDIAVQIGTALKRKDLSGLFRPAEPDIFALHALGLHNHTCRLSFDLSGDHITGDWVLDRVKMPEQLWTSIPAPKWTERHRYVTVAAISIAFLVGLIAGLYYR